MIDLYADIQRVVKHDGRILRIATIEHYDSGWKLMRTYYYIADQFGQRYSDDCVLPEWAWSAMDNEPQDDYLIGGLDSTLSFE